jgi:hypothetical protein
MIPDKRPKKEGLIVFACDQIKKQKFTAFFKAGIVKNMISCRGLASPINKVI